jgi:hypothetical protein
MTILALRGWRSGLVGRAERGRELLRERERVCERLRLRLRLSRVPLAGPGPLLRERDREASRGVTERAWDLDRASSGVGERPRDGLRLSDIGVRLIDAELRSGRYCMFVLWLWIFAGSSGV